MRLKDSKIKEAIEQADSSLTSSEVNQLLLAAKKSFLADENRKQQEQHLQAIIFTIQNHKGQRRKSGEPFAIHPLEVANILASNNLEYTTIIAGLFHDLIEDCEITKADIEKAFPDIGEEVAFLVDGVTKITGAAAAGARKSRDYAGYQKFIIAAAADVRVLLIKLADRLHNLRTIQFLNTERKKRIAEETLYIYAPLAHRIGMTQIKSELEDRSLAIVDPTAYNEASLLIEEAKKYGETKLKELSQSIEKNLRKEGIRDYKITSRIKSIFSIAEKLKRYSSNQEYLLEDILGIRIIVQTVSECYLALGIVHNLYPPKTESFDDYIALPRSNLYQSLHTAVLAPFGDTKKIIEIQIRTEEMDEIAERGIAAHWQYKAKFRNQGTPELDFSIKTEETAGNDIDIAFQKLKAELLSQETYCFTPEGEIKFLPTGANAIDFAYALHSDLGDQISGARADGALYPITKPLPNNAVIEIITNRNSTPSIDWLESVVTPRAKQRIRAFHSSGPNSAHKKQLLGLLRADLRKAGLPKQASLSEKQLVHSLVDTVDDIPEDRLLLKLDQQSFRGQLVNQFIKNHENQVSISQRPAQKKPRKNLSEPIILIEGNADIKYRIAGCCHPEPGDEIIGYISRNKDMGVIIHRKTCSNINNMVNKAKPNPVVGLVEAHFGDREEVVFQSRINFKFKDRPGLLSNLAEVVYLNGAEIINIESRSKMGIVRGNILCKVAGKRASEKLREDIKTIDGSLEVK